MQLTTIQTASPATISFNLSCIDDFIRYIDRGQKTTRTYLMNLKQFAAWLKFAQIINPVRQDIISYRQYLSTEHDAITLDSLSPAGWSYRTDRNGNPIKINCKPNTVKQYLRNVCQLFKWTASTGIYPNIAENIHAPKVKADTHKKEALTPADVFKIESTIDRTTTQGKRLYAMYLLAVNAGLRTIELNRANIKDLETKGGQTWLYIWGKGHTEPDQKKPIAPEVKAAIDDYLQSRTDSKTGNSPLFTATGNRSGGKRIATTTISTMLKRAMQAAGYDSERLTAHSLRHTCGTNTQEITGNIYLTQQYMRHANPATTEIYLHCETDKQETDLARRLYNRYHGIEETNDRQQAESLFSTLTADQIKQLAGIAAAMTRNNTAAF
ncbi:MAG: tyrosine-type recombinase/integrase [Elusimicrobiaceae bacterium]|nr:tyrosine-type recombinase/integrase [Elusimicrobiaceae bacterium]